ncbi:dynein light chain, putative, partial [Plasmodium malariae]
RSDIPYYNQNNIVDIITGVLDKYTDANTNDINVENAIKNIKEILDKTFGTGWICLIGEKTPFYFVSIKDTWLSLYINAKFIEKNREKEEKGEKKRKRKGKEKGKEIK